MYKSLSAALVAAFTAYLYFYFDLAPYQDYFSKPNATSPLPDSTYNVSEMAVASVSRSVVQKVLSIETPEVRPILSCLAVFTNAIYLIGRWCTCSPVYWWHEA